MRMVKLKTYSSVFIEDNIILKFKLLFNFRAPSAEFQLKLRNIIIKLRAVILPFFDNWTYSKILFQGRRNFGTVYQKENGNPPATVILLNSKDNFNKRFWENIHFGRVMVWYGANQMIIYFSKASILLYVTLFIFLFKLSCWKIAGAARNWTNYVPQTAATTFAFFSFFHGTLSRAVMLFGNTWGRNMDYSARENTSDQWSSCWVRVHKGLLE